MLYRYHVTPQSPLCTDLMSDTFFGHFCWALRYTEGESFLKDFLDLFEQNNPAPVLFSSAFVSNSLPRPSIPPPSRSEIRDFVERFFGKDRKSFFQGLSTIKKWNKKKFLKVEQWLMLKDEYSDIKLYEDFLTQKDSDEKHTSVDEIYASNTINRITGKVHEGGGLFHREKHWYENNSNFDLYVEVNDTLIEPHVKKFLTDYLPTHGFGADTSTGMGCLDIKEDNTFNFEHFSVSHANARLSLCLASFPEMDKINALYRLKTKLGKLGGTYAVFNPQGGNPRPFKKPLLMYEPGAVFFCTHSLSNSRLLRNVHSNPSIRHCGIPITLPFTLKEDGRYDTKIS